MNDWLGTIRYRVLLVEDHLDTLDVTARLLRFEGWEVTTAATMMQALRQVENGGRVDVLVADVGLPDGDGVTLLRRAREMRPDLPAIAITAYGMVEDVERNLAAGFDRHLTKPVRGADIVEAIREVVGTRHAVVGAVVPAVVLGAGQYGAV